MLLSTAFAIREFVSRLSQSREILDYEMRCFVEPENKDIRKDTPCRVYLYSSKPSLSAYGRIWDFAKSLESLSDLGMCEVLGIRGTRVSPFRDEPKDFMAVVLY